MRTLDVAGIRIGLRHDDVRLARLFEEKYGTFLDDGPANAEIVFELNEAAFADSVGSDALDFELSGTRNRLGFRSCVCDGWFDADSLRGAFSVVPGTGSRTVDPICNFLRYVCSFLAAQQELLVLHASGVYHRERDEGFVFAGVSGAGKSTIALLSHQAGSCEVLNDDLVICGMDGDQPMVSGTPFCGDIRYKISLDAWTPANNRRCRLAGLYLIRQAASPALEQLSPSDQMSSLIGSVLYVNHFSPDRVEQAMTTLARLIGVIPVERLLFSEDASFWKVI